MICLFDSTRPRWRPSALVAFAAALALALIPAMAPAQAPEPPGGMVLPLPEGEAAKVDPRVEPAQAPGSLDEAALPAGGGGDDNPLPASKERPGAAPAAAPSTGATEGDHFALPVDRLSMGRQEVKLSIEVQQPGPVINLNKESAVSLVVKNGGTVDAVGVSVIYQLPDGLEFLSSLPEQEVRDSVNTALYYFKKPTLAAGAAWTIPIKVIARKVKTCDHAATVTAKAGARASVIVQEPKLKVEQTASPGRVLKGEQVHFQISVTNPGTGPARNVVVQAKLSDGLRLGNDDIVEQTIPVIRPGERIDLDTLTVDTRAGGQQNCVVVVSSPDVVPVPEEAKAMRMVEVTKPELKVDLKGHEHRYTEQKNEFTLIVTNPGTAPARNVKVIATMPTAGGRLFSVGENSQGFVYDRPSKKLIWNIAQLEPNQAKEYTFVHQTTGPGLYSMLADATSGELRANARVATDVTGLAVVGIEMHATNRIIDVGDTTIYDIRIKNHGTREATKILLSGSLSTNLKITAISGLDKEVKFNTKDGRFTFPEIDRLAPNGTLTLSIEAEAIARGNGICRITLDHSDLPHGEKASPDDLIQAVAHTTVTGESRPRVGSTRP